MQSRRQLGTFEETGLSQPILKILKKHEITVPSQIQVKFYLRTLVTCIIFHSIFRNLEFHQY